MMTTRRARRQKSAANLLPVGLVRPIEVRVDEIFPAPENDVYRAIHAADPQMQELAAAVASGAFISPLLVSRDRFIISGHRRHFAHRMAHKETVFVYVEDIRRDEEPDRFVRLLVDHNGNRDKTAAEKLREAIVQANPDDCYQELLEYRRKKSAVGLVRLDMGAVKGRKRISHLKRPMADAIIRCLDELKDFWPVSDRKVHYQLLNDPPLRNTSKPGSRYVNTETCYKDTCDMLTRMRLSGEIPFDCINDETRPQSDYQVHANLGPFFQNEWNWFLRGYRRDLLQSQPNHIEFVCEKNTVANIIAPICDEFCIPMTSGRGYCSLPPRRDMWRRYHRSGKTKLIILIASDFDPEGEDIARQFGQSMRDDFGIPDVHPHKVALTAEQAKRFDLPVDATAKEDGARYRAFVEKYGENVWELEALDPNDLQDLTKDSILEALDLEMLEVERRNERNDSVQASALRDQIMQFAREAGFGTEGGTE